MMLGMYCFLLSSSADKGSMSDGLGQCQRCTGEPTLASRPNWALILSWTMSP